MFEKLYRAHRKTRATEHEKAVFSGNYKESALSEHAKTCHEGIEWEKACTLSTEPFYYRRTIMEALQIQRDEVKYSGTKYIKLEAGQYVTTNTWRPFLKKLGKVKQPNIK